VIATELIVNAAVPLLLSVTLVPEIQA